MKLDLPYTLVHSRYWSDIWRLCHQLRWYFICHTFVQTNRLFKETWTNFRNSFLSAIRGEWYGKNGVYSWIQEASDSLTKGVFASFINEVQEVLTETIIALRIASASRNEKKKTSKVFLFQPTNRSRNLI